jgi:hypothetical protein
MARRVEVPARPGGPFALGPPGPIVYDQVVLIAITSFVKKREELHLSVFG